MNFNEAKRFLNESGYELIDEALTRGEYNKKFNRVARAIWMKTDYKKDLQVIMDELMNNDEVGEYIADETYSSDEIADKWIRGEI